MSDGMTGLSGLDEVTGGIPPHSLTMLLGPPGAGKTILAWQLAAEHVHQGGDVVFFSVNSETHEKLIDHLRSLSFFDDSLIGESITLLSLKAAISQGYEQTLETILGEIRGKRKPLLIVDGYRSLYQRLGSSGAQEFLSTLSSQLPYYKTQCIMTTTARVHDSNEFSDLSPADVLISLSSVVHDAPPLRTIEILKVRGHGFLEGVHGMEITANGIVVYPRLAALLPQQTPPAPPGRQLFGLPSFDAMLGGGLPRCSTTVLEGDTGTGRTTFGLHYLLAGAEAGETGLFVALGDAAEDLLQKARELGLPLDAAIDQGRIHILAVPPVELNPFRLAWDIRTLVEQQQVSRCVIDSITAFEGAVSIEGAQQDYLGALALYLRRRTVTTVMTQDTPLTGKLHSPPIRVRMPAADNHVLLRQVVHEGHLHRLCSILTMQRSAHESRIREFRIAGSGIQVLDGSDSDQALLQARARDGGYRLR